MDGNRTRKHRVDAWFIPLQDMASRKNTQVLDDFNANQKPTVLVDSGYLHQKRFTPNNMSCRRKSIHASVRARNGSCSARHRCFNIIQDELRNTANKTQIYISGCYKTCGTQNT